MCGAPAASDASRCEHCGARLATVACPSCFGLIFQGAKFCSHCGARVGRSEDGDAKPEPCPRCNINMDAVVIGQTHMRECSKCEGLWVEVDTLKQICNDREQQAAVLGMAGPLPPADGNIEEHVHYLPCPVCKNFMNRVNFANCSHVVVDVCRQHGTWFDKDELRRIVEFIREGGMERSREREIEELQRRRSELASAQTAGAWNAPLPDQYSRFDDRHIGISIAAAVLKTLFG